MADLVYHITSAEQITRASAMGEYTPSAFASDGFIHCSYSHQIRQVANVRFLGRVDLVLLEIDRARLFCTVLDENLEGGKDLYPHVYGPLPMSAVVRILEFPCSRDGTFELPRGVGV